MAATKSWAFQQLGGQQRTIVLAGRAAPHGRPRKGAVVSDGIKLRFDRVYYPDAKGPPTTHVFGVAYEPWTLKGRFADADLGAGGTRQMIAEWQSFLADAEEVLVTWGDIITARGLVTRFTPGRESEFECTYEIDVEIDEELGAFANESQTGISQKPGELCAALQAELAEGAAAIPASPRIGELKPSLLDTLDDLVSIANSGSAALLKVANEFDAFVGGTLDQLERLRSGSQQVRTAVLRMHGTLERIDSEEILSERAIDAETFWGAVRADNEVSVLRMLALLDEIDRQAELAQRGQVLTIYTARGGDSWESISRQFYGGPEGAGRIRDANGVQYGEIPLAGRGYQIPSA